MSADNTLATTMATSLSVPNQPFRFLDLPAEIRYIVYEYLSDRFMEVQSSRNEIQGLILSHVYVRNCFHPQLFRVSKQVNGEYSKLAFRDLGLHIFYTTSDFYKRVAVDPSAVAQLLAVPPGALMNFTSLDLDFHVCDDGWPAVNPFGVMLELIQTMDSLESVWLRFDVGVNLHTTEDDVPSIFQCLALRLWLSETHDSLQQMAENDGFDRNIQVYIICKVVCRFFELNPRVFDPLPDDDHHSGVVQAPGLPPSGFVTFQVLTTPTETSFEWRGLNLEFAGIDSMPRTQVGLDELERLRQLEMTKTQRGLQELEDVPLPGLMLRSTKASM